MFSKKIKVYKSGTTSNGISFLLGRICNYGIHNKENIAKTKCDMVFLSSSKGIPFEIKDGYAKISLIDFIYLKKYDFMEALEKYYSII